MRSKQLLPLAILLVVLVVAVVFLKRQPAPTKLADEVGFERLVPASLTADAIQGIDLYQGAKKDEAVKLRREGDAWVAASYHNAPVKADKVAELLGSVSGLEGDVRADKAEVLDAFKLKDDQALHLLIYTDKPDQPEAHLLAGKSSGRSGFMRSADQNRVFNVDLNLRSEAGIYGDEEDKVPEAKPWLNLQLQDIPKDQVTGIELQMPDRRVQLALKKVEPETPAEDKKAEGDEAKAEDKPEAAATPPAKPEWELVEPKVDYPIKQGVVEGLASTLRTLRGDDVVASDSDKASGYGFDSPPYRAVLTVEEKDKDARQVTVTVGNTVSEEDEKRYVRLEQDNSPVYLLPKWSFNQVFPTLGTILSLDVLDLQTDEIVRVSWQQDGESLMLERQPAPSEEKPASDEVKPADGEEKATAPKPDVWRWVQAPVAEPGAVVEAEKLTKLLDSVERLTANDWFATAPAEAGLDKPALSLSLTLRDGTTHEVVFGQTHGKDEDRYVGVPGKDDTFVIAKTSYTAISDALKPLRPEAPASSAAPESPSQPVVTPSQPAAASPQPAAAPALKTMPAPTAGLPKPDTPSVPSTESIVKTAPEGASITLPKQEVMTTPNPATETESAPPSETKEKP